MTKESCLIESKVRGAQHHKPGCRQKNHAQTCAEELELSEMMSKTTFMDRVKENKKTTEKNKNLEVV